MEFVIKFSPIAIGTMAKAVLSIFMIASLFLLADAVPVLEAENNKVIIII